MCWRFVEWATTSCTLAVVENSLRQHVQFSLGLNAFTLGFSVIRCGASCQHQVGGSAYSSDYGSFYYGGEMYSQRLWVSWRRRRLYSCAIEPMRNTLLSVAHHGGAIVFFRMLLLQECAYSLEDWRVFLARSLHFEWFAFR